MPRSRVNPASLDSQVKILTDVSSAAYAESQVVKALGTLKKFSSEGEIAHEASVSKERLRAAMEWLTATGLVERSAPGTGKLWRLSAEGLEVLKAISAAARRI